MTTTPLLSVLPADGRERLMQFAQEVSFPAGTRLFEEHGSADRFWIIRTGSVNLDIQVAGGRSVVVDMLGHGDLVGWSWVVPPYTWRMGAEAFTPSGRTNSMRRRYVHSVRRTRTSASQ